MKRLWWLLLFPAGVLAQQSNSAIILVTSAPAGACTSGLPNQQVITTGILYSCQDGMWSTVGGGGGTWPGYPGVGIVVSTGSAWDASLAETDGNILFGAAGAWTKGTALPNGITATTQSQANNSTRVATTAYVDTGLATKGTVTAVSVATANGVSGTSSGGATPALTIALGAITPTSTNGVSSTTMAFMDASSSVQTQLNGKQATLTSGSVPLADLATQAADSLVINATGGSASPTAVAMPTCTTGADLYNTSTHTWSCVGSGSSVNVNGGSTLGTAALTNNSGAGEIDFTNPSGATVNASLHNTSVTVDGSTCTLGSTCVGSMPLFFGGLNASSQLQATTIYYVWQASATSLASATAQYVMPTAGTYANLNLVATAAPTGVQTLIATVYKCSPAISSCAATAITCTITGSATTCSDTAHSFAYSAGDGIALQVVSSATAATTRASGSLR